MFGSMLKPNNSKCVTGFLAYVIAGTLGLLLIIASSCFAGAMAYALNETTNDTTNSTLAESSSDSLWYQSPAPGVMTSSLPTELSMGSFDVAYLPLEIDPSSAQAGISCNMDGMCGLDPCLCGEMDEWGYCACNGYETVYPTCQAQSSSPRLFAFVVKGGLLLVSLGSEEASVELSAQMLRYDDATWTTLVQVEPFGIADILRIVGVLVLVGALISGIVFCVRKLVRVVSTRKLSANSSKEEQGIR